MSNRDNPWREAITASGAGLRRRKGAYLGMDEKSFKRGHSYITLLTDQEQSRVVEVVADRTTESGRAVVGQFESGTKGDRGSGGHGHVVPVYPDGAGAGAGRRRGA